MHIKCFTIGKYIKNGKEGHILRYNSSHFNHFSINQIDSLFKIFSPRSRVCSYVRKKKHRKIFKIKKLNGKLFSQLISLNRIGY